MTHETKNRTESLPLIDTLWNYNDPKGTEARFRELLPKATNKKDQAYYAELLTQLARTQSLQRNFDQAHAILDTAEKMMTDGMTIPRIRYYLERGRTYNSAGNRLKASELFRKAYTLAFDNQQDFYAVDAAHMLGISEPSEQQMKWNLKAMELAEASADSRAKGWLGPLYNNLGWTYHDMKIYDKALELFEKSLTLRESKNDEKGTFIARWTIARCYRSMNRVQEALDRQYQLLKEIESGKAMPDGYVNEEIGECLLLQGKAEEAKPYFEEAYNILCKDAWLQDNETERLERLKKLGS